MGRIFTSSFCFQFVTVPGVSPDLTLEVQGSQLAARTQMQGSGSLMQPDQQKAEVSMLNLQPSGFAADFASDPIPWMTQPWQIPSGSEHSTPVLGSTESGQTDRNADEPQLPSLAQQSELDVEFDGLHIAADIILQDDLPSSPWHPSSASNIAASIPFAAGNASLPGSSLPEMVPLSR